jgi:hypothetical protein
LILYLYTDSFDSWEVYVLTMERLTDRQTDGANQYAISDREELKRVIKSPYNLKDN